MDLNLIHRSGYNSSKLSRISSISRLFDIILSSTIGTKINKDIRDAKVPGGIILIYPQ